MQTVHHPDELLAAWGSYTAADNPRTQAQILAPNGAGANYHLDETTRKQLIELARHNERNNQLFDGFLGNWCDILLGTHGPIPVWSSTNEKWTAEATALFTRDATGPDNVLSYTREHNWKALCVLMARALARDGEVAHWTAIDGSAALYETDRIHSLARDPRQRLTGAYLHKLNKYNRPTRERGELLPAAETTLIRFLTRSGQDRGCTPLVAGLDQWERLDSLMDAEVISAENAALIWTVFKRSPGAAAPVPGSNTTAPGVKPKGWQRTDAGSILVTPAGIDAETWAPDRPNLDVPAFIKAALRYLCLPLLPYEVAYMDLEGLSYAATRGIGKLAQTRLESQQQLLSPALTRQAQAWLKYQTDTGRLAPAPADATLRWDWPVLDVRDRERDAAATEKELSNGTTNLAEVVGPDWAAKRRQRAKEMELDRELGLILDAKAGADTSPQAQARQAMAAANVETLLANYHMMHGERTQAPVTVEQRFSMDATTALNMGTAIAAAIRPTEIHLPAPVIHVAAAKVTVPPAAAPQVHIAVSPTPVTVENTVVVEQKTVKATPQRDGSVLMVPQK